MGQGIQERTKSNLWEKVLKKFEVNFWSTLEYLDPYNSHFCSTKSRQNDQILFLMVCKFSF